MALDIHKNDEKREWLLSLKESQRDALYSIFENFYQQSGILIDAYSDCILDVGKQKLLVKLIDQFIEKSDLNQYPKTTVEILSFRGFLTFTIGKQWGLALYCD